MFYVLPIQLKCDHFSHVQLIMYLNCTKMYFGNVLCHVNLLLIIKLNSYRWSGTVLILTIFKEF